MLSSQIAIDELFDLDLALTMPEDSTIELDEHHPQSAADARHLVDELPTVVMGGEGDHKCTVCIEGFSVGGRGKQLVPCGHVFHENCIFQWLSVHDSCPLCRGKVSGDGKFLHN